MTIAAKATWVEDRRFVGQSSSGHGIVVDASSDKLGPSPMELVLVAWQAVQHMMYSDIFLKKVSPIPSIKQSGKIRQ